MGVCRVYGLYRAHEATNQVLGFKVIVVIMVQVLGKYMIIKSLNP